MVALRIPFTLPFPPPVIHPPNASTLAAAISAVSTFLESRPTVLLTGAGISVESGLADYRGEKGTYRVNQKYRPTFYPEFAGNHEARKRYWARSFIGWQKVSTAQPNRTHGAISRLGELGLVTHVITQNVDSLHHISHPHLRTTELHGNLRTVTCLTCHSHYPRAEFQKTLAGLNPRWAEFLRSATEAGVSQNNTLRKAGAGIKTNPDGDVDIPGAPYTIFRYPPCQRCLESNSVRVLVDNDGAHIPEEGTGAAATTNGVVKSSVTFFGEPVSEDARIEAESMVGNSAGVLVVGSSLATYSAWRLVRAAHNAGKGVCIVNLGGVRGEEIFFSDEARGRRVRVEFGAAEVLGGVVRNFEG